MTTRLSTFEKRILKSGDHFFLRRKIVSLRGFKEKNALKELKGLLGDINIAASDDITGRDGDWELEIGDQLTALQLPHYPYNLQTGDGTPSWKAAREGDEDASGEHGALFDMKNNYSEPKGMGWLWLF